jgi:hypothetical protein
MKQGVKSGFVGCGTCPNGGQASGRLERENRYKSLETLEKLPRKQAERSS